MLKKLMLLVASVCALVAVAAPAGAQAQELYTLSGKTHVPLTEGTKVKATSTNLKVSNPSWYYPLECTKVIIAGEVSENSAAKSRLGNTVAEWPEFGVCNSATSLYLGEIRVEAGELGLMDNLELKVANCFNDGDIPLTYKHDTNTLTVTGTEQLRGRNCGGWYLFSTMTASFTLTTPTGTPVYIE